MRTRANPHGLPPRLYERVSDRRITWWTKATDGTTTVIRSISKLADEEQVKLARAAAVELYSVKQGRQRRATTDQVADWVANAGTVEPKATRVRDGLPAWSLILFQNSKRRAKARGILWSLTKQDFLDIARRCNGLCEVSGHPLSLTVTGQRGPYGPSIDRIAGNLGYTRDNVRIVCVAVNFALNSWGVDAFLPIAKAMVNRHTDSKV